jgi:hypothetical protein
MKTVITKQHSPANFTRIKVRLIHHRTGFGVDMSVNRRTELIRVATCHSDDHFSHSGEIDLVPDRKSIAERD